MNPYTPTPYPRTIRSPVYTRGGVVCSVSPLAASTGVRVLASGGNAFDAAIAVAAVEAVTVPPMCGLGGDLFAILYHARSGRLVAINASGGAPTGATPEFFHSQGYTRMPTFGPLSPSIPGEVDAWERILGMFGTRSLRELLQPAIDIAEEGFPVPPKLATSFQREAKRLNEYPSTAAAYTFNGRPPAAGDVLVLRDLARSLRAVAEGGAREFYRGDLARAIVRGVREAGGLFTEEDLAAYEAEVYEPPISTTYRGYTVYQTRPPSQGFIMLEMLNIVEGFDLASMGPLSAQQVHVLVEAKKLAFADRVAYMGDPRFVQTPLEELLSKEHAARRRQLIDLRRAAEVVPPATLAEVAGDTSSFCVVDREGNAVSLIHSLSNVFGSNFVAGDTGILLNNRAGRGFYLEPGHPNVIAPGKRTMHTLNCWMVFQQGRPFVLGNSPGGDFQPQGNAQVLINMLDFKMDPQHAVEAPRWVSFPGSDTVSLGQPLEVRLETTMPEQVRRELEAMGHRVVQGAEGISHGVFQVVMLDHERGIKIGASDPRGDGHAAAV